MKRILLVLLILLHAGLQLIAQNQQGYWNLNTTLLPRRMPLPTKDIERIDLDKDGDPDVMKYTILNGIPVMWIDDDDDMKWTDIEGDMNNDCLTIDRNKDGKFAGYEDLSVDFVDFENDGKANMQWVVENGKENFRFNYDWSKSNVMAFIDEDQEGVFNYIDWNLLTFRHWERNGHSNFFTDYQGNITFTKHCASSNRFSDIRYSWENPFIFWDNDHDGLSEVALRMLDIPEIRKDTNDPAFKSEKPDVDFRFTHKITYVAISYDIDNDNGQGNELDFDLSLKFEGPGFDYSDQVNKFPNLRGLPEANQFLHDSKWREIDELIFPNRQNAISLTYKRGNWNKCTFVFDEDDDCNRWERVEFLDPKNLFASGKNNNGLDHNPQADVVGDRGEFDLDFSGKGNLYVGAFDGKIHLVGAEWGAWRIDQTLFAFQGYGGLYDRKKHERIQEMPDRFATVKYADTDNNGFFDEINYDLNGDTIFEETVSLLQLGINDKQAIIESSKLSFKDYETLFENIAENNWLRALQALELSAQYGLKTEWYNFWKNPRTFHEKYDYAYWLNFYIYQDLRQLAKSKGDQQLVAQFDKAYYSGDWKLIKNELFKK